MIYLDSCLVIYAVEDVGDAGRRVRQMVSAAGSEQFAISWLVQMECLVAPLRRADPLLAQRYSDAFEQFVVLGLDQAVYRDAATLRATFGVKAPDALHVAAARAAGCTALWTGDRRLAHASQGLAVAVL